MPVDLTFPYTSIVTLREGDVVSVRGVAEHMSTLAIEAYLESFCPTGECDVVFTLMWFHNTAATATTGPSRTFHVYADGRFVEAV